MMNLLLKSAAKHRSGGPWDADDYDVHEGNQRIGRIMRHPQTPQDRPWFWTITTLDMPPSVYNRGYSATREQAMSDFKLRWTERQQ